LGEAAYRSEALRHPEALFRVDVDDLDVGILVVPLRGDAFEGEAEGLALAGCEWGGAEVDGFGIGAAGFQDA
jgi:hypothetical protein